MAVAIAAGGEDGEGGEESEGEALQEGREEDGMAGDDSAG